MSADETSSSDIGVSGLWSRLFRGRADEVKTRQGIADFLAEFRDRGVLAPDELAMLLGVLDVSNTQVRDIMVPRSQMVVLGKDHAPDELLKTIIQSNHSRFPVIGDDRDEVVGIVLAKDVLKHFVEDASRESFDIEPLLRPAVFIPESKRLSTLLAEFREGRNHMAIVVDEYGGVAGAATIQPQEDGRYIVLALTRIEEFNEFFGTKLSDEQYDTVGGLVMHELGRLPRRGEQLDFAGFRFKVLRGDRRRLHTLEVTRAPA